MKSAPKTVSPAASTDYTRKIAATVGGVAMGLSGLADAGIVHHVGGGVDYTITGSGFNDVLWNIDQDGAGNHEFALYGFGSAFATGPNSSVNVDLQGGAIYETAAGAGLLANTTGGLAIFGAGSQIGPTVATTTGATLFYATNLATTGGYPLVSYVYSPLSDGDNSIGFQFMIGTDSLLGWANFYFDSDFPMQVEITEWAYCDQDGCSIDAGDVGSVPEPALPSLLLLGMGAVGVARWKKNKREASL